MASILSLLASVPSRVWGIVATVVACGLILWAIFSAGKSEGKAKAEAKADIEIAEINTRVETERAKRAEVVTKAIAEDSRVIEEIENEIAALPDSDIVLRARRWVRNKAPDSN